ncbi:hypothetical protein M3650_03520 [Paenibacillus sp. MER TA 81-3]|uniref:hypothetical protein n=1 Tax=Paenibacillus sp. MER TA 81-3 TaxID=2939573 RepID=UPI0020410F28|nr:hypothetical protein [Paenibacillus sp. MER TA 81-3]MCM3337731.1 hypothetical protein [Paenibacillus sp. MER TA 81-3]
MKKHNFILMLTIILSLVLSACSSNKETPIEATLPAKEMADQMIAQVEQPALIELQADMVKELYHLDPALVRQRPLSRRFRILMKSWNI